MPTSSVEDYLKCILLEQQRVPEALVTTGQISSALKVTPGSATAMVKTLAPPAIIGSPLAESGIRSKYGITVVAIKHPGEDFTHAALDTVVRDGDILIVAGRSTQVELFADLT